MTTRSMKEIRDDIQQIDDDIASYTEDGTYTVEAAGRRTELVAELEEWFAQQ